MKSEEEATGERFTQWMTDTYDILNKIDNKSVCELRAYKNPHPDCLNVLKSIAPLFGCKTEKEIQLS